MSDLIETQSLNTIANRYQSIGKLAVALSQAQSEFKDVHKNATANIGKYSYNYATLPNVIDAIKDALFKFKLSYTQLVQTKNENTILLTLIMHESGAVLESEYRLPDPSKTKPQEFASHLTYARRYALTSALGVAADDDEDGNIANKNEPASPGDFVMPFGKSKGKKLSELSTDEILGAKAWCVKTDANKFKQLITTIDAFLGDK